jgi:hypothetical protein
MFTYELTFGAIFAYRPRPRVLRIGYIFKEFAKCPGGWGRGRSLAGAHECRPIKELGRGLDSCGCWLLRTWQQALQAGHLLRGIEQCWGNPLMYAQRQLGR